MEGVFDYVHQDASGSCGTLSSSSRRTSDSGISFESSTTPPTTPLLKTEWFNWAEDVEEELERIELASLALNQGQAYNDDQTSDSEQNLDKERIDNIQIDEKQTDEEHIDGEYIAERQIWRTLGENLNIDEPCHYRLATCAWDLYHLTCSLTEYKEYAQQQIINAQQSPVPLLVLTDDTGANYLLEEVVQILSEEEIHWIRQHRDPYQEDLENYVISCAPSYAELGSEIDNNSQLESEQSFNESDEGYCHGHTYDILGDDGQHQVYDMSYGQSNRPNSYLMSYRYYDDDSLGDLSEKNRSIHEISGKVESIRDGLKEATYRQSESDDLAESSQKLEEAMKIIERLTSYAERLKVEVTVLKAERRAAAELKQKAEADREELQKQETKQYTEKLEDANETVAELQQYVASLTAEVKRSRAACQIAITEKENTEADLQALRDEIANQSVNTGSLSAHLEEKNYELQDELANLQELFAKTEKQHRFAVQEIEFSRKKLESNELVKGNWQRDADDEYLLQLRLDAVGSGEFAIGGDCVSEQGLFSEVLAHQHDEVLSSGKGDISVGVVNGLTDKTALDDTMEESLTKSNTEQPIVNSDDSGNFKGIPIDDDGISEKKTASRSWAFGGRNPVTLAGPGKLGLSAFHSAFNQSAGSILGVQDKRQEKFANAKINTEPMELKDPKQHDATKAFSTNFANEYYSFTFLKSSLERAEEVSHQNSRQNADCEDVGFQQDQTLSLPKPHVVYAAISSIQQDQTLSLPKPHVVYAAISSSQTINSDGEGAVGEDAIGDAVGGFDLCHGTADGLDGAGKNQSFGDASDNGEAGTDKVARSDTGGGYELYCSTNASQVVHGTNSTIRDHSPSNNADGGGASEMGDPGDKFSCDTLPKKTEVSAKLWKRLLKFLSETASAMSDQFGAVGTAYFDSRETSYVEIDYGEF